jgi:hypothetical protein
MIVGGVVSAGAGVVSPGVDAIGVIMPDSVQKSILGHG